MAESFLDGFRRPAESKRFRRLFLVLLKKPFVCPQGRQVEARPGGLLGEDEQGDLGPLLLQVLDEERNLHGATDLPKIDSWELEISCHAYTDLAPDGGDPALVAEERVHGDRVLDDQGRDGDEGQHQHVQDEELLTIGSGGVNVVASNSPHRVLHPLRQIIRVTLRQ